MQTGDFTKVPVIAEYREAILQRARRDSHVIGRNGTSAASELPKYDCILRCRLRIDDQLVHPLRRQKLLQFLTIGLCTRSNGKAAEQFAEHNT